MMFASVRWFTTSSPAGYLSLLVRRPSGNRAGRPTRGSVVRGGAPGLNLVKEKRVSNGNKGCLMAVAIFAAGAWFGFLLAHVSVVWH